MSICRIDAEVDAPGDARSRQRERGVHVGPLRVEEVLARRPARRRRRLPRRSPIGKDPGGEAEVDVASVGPAQAPVAAARVDDLGHEGRARSRVAQAAEHPPDRRPHAVFLGGGHDAPAAARPD